MAENVSTPQHCPGYADFKNLKAFTANAPNAAKKRKSFQMNLTAPTLAVNAGNPSIFQNVKSPVKAKVYPPDKRCCFPGAPGKSPIFYLEDANKISLLEIL